MNKELLPLPFSGRLLINWEDKSKTTTLYTADQMREYALANLQAAKPAHTCNYPDCNCPFDAPADPNWCARGLPKKNNATQNATMQSAESIAAQRDSENSATENATLPATGALGSLPVVGYGFPNTAVTGHHQPLMMIRHDIPSNDQYDGKLWKPLTLHAQATAELAKRDEIIERYSMCIRENQAEIERLRAKLAVYEATHPKPLP